MRYHRFYFLLLSYAECHRSVSPEQDPFAVQGDDKVDSLENRKQGQSTPETEGS